MPWRLVNASVVAAALLSPAAVVPATAAAAPAPPVVAIIGEPGALNVLHSDFHQAIVRLPSQ